jgi:Uncharacterized protein conserved in bacteria
MSLVEEMQALELKLLHQDHRAAPEELEALLAPEFQEVASSGHRSDRAAVMRWLLQKDPAWRWELRELSVDELTSELRLVRYHARQIVPLRPESKGAWHSSLWHRNGAGQWQLRFHQATRLP